MTGDVHRLGEEGSRCGTKLTFLSLGFPQTPYFSCELLDLALK